MSIQNIINRAQSIEIDRRKIAAQSVSRSQRVKMIERDSALPWRFKVTPPAQLDWASSRGFIEVIDTNDRVAEYTISLNNTSGMNYITEYQGALNQIQLDALTISTSSTATLTLSDLPSVGSVISTSTVSVTAKSFAYANSITYNRALSTTRSDFLMPTSTYDNMMSKPLPGDVLSASPYIVSSQTVSSITRNYTTIGGVSYTRIVMSGAPDVNSPAAVVDSDSDILITATRTTSLGSGDIVLAAGDFIQPANSRYPYTVKENVLRGSSSTVTVQLNRPIITSEGITIAGQGVNIGNDVTWRVVLSTLPTYQLIPGRRVQYTGDFEMIERII